MSTLEVNTINPQSGNDVTIGGSSKNVKFASGTTVDFNTNTPTLTLGSAMKMTPSFFASKTSGSQSVSHNTWTKVTFDSETFDTDSAFADSKFTVPSGEAGKYFFTVQVCVQQGSVLLKTLLNGYYKNGSSIQDQREIETRTDSPLYEYTLNKSIILDLSASDYIEFYIKPQTTDSSATDIRSGSATNLMTFFQGYKLIGV